MAATEALVDLLEFRDLQKGATVYSIELPELKEHLVRHSGELANLPLVVCTKASVTPEYVLEESTRIRKKSKLDLVVTDHMQLMAAIGTVRGDYGKFTAISRTMKQIAVDLALPTACLSN